MGAVCIKWLDARYIFHSFAPPIHAYMHSNFIYFYILTIGCFLPFFFILFDCAKWAFWTDCKFSVWAPEQSYKKTSKEMIKYCLSHYSTHYSSAFVLGVLSCLPPFHLFNVLKIQRDKTNTLIHTAKQQRKRGGLAVTTTQKEMRWDKPVLRCEYQINPLLPPNMDLSRMENK